MSQDFLSMYSDSWFNSGDIVESVSNTDLGANYFQEEYDNPAYDVEQNFFSNVLTESVNLHGVKCIYVVTTYNTNSSSNRIFGEDRNRSAIRQFNFNAQFQLPKEQEAWLLNFGIQDIDSFIITVSKNHFNTASSYNSTQTSAIFPPYIPVEGDLICTPYNNSRFYEVVTVHSQDQQYLKRSYSYNITLRPYRKNQLNVSASINNETLIGLEETLNDIFNTSADIQTLKPPIEFNPSSTEPQNPFGNWG
jgi:hypothetical protein